MSLRTMLVPLLFTACGNVDEVGPEQSDPRALGLASVSCVMDVVEVAAGVAITVNWENLDHDADDESLDVPLRASATPLIWNLAIDGPTALAACDDPHVYGSDGALPLYGAGVHDQTEREVHIPASMMSPDGGADILGIEAPEGSARVMLLPTTTSSVTTVAL
jgi:hypothetical protein